jgi:hypothetical protein
MIAMVEPRCSGRRSIVVGSAPGVRIPEPADGDVYVAANGAARLVPRVDVWNVPVYLFTGPTGELMDHTRREIQGARPDVVWLDTADGVVEDALAGFGRHDIVAKQIMPLSAALRDAVVYAACGERLGAGIEPERVSTGFFCMCLALLSGGNPVVICGLSLHEGHDGLPGWRGIRGHTPADERCLSAVLARHGERLQTTSTELRERGMAWVDG